MEKIKHCILVPDICEMKISTKVPVINFLVPLITEKKLLGFFQSLKSYLIKTQGSNEDLFQYFFSVNLNL